MSNTSKKKKRKVKKKHSVARYILYGIFAILAILLITALGFFYGAVKSTPDINDVNILPTTNPSYVYDSEGNELIQLSSWGARRTEVTSDEIPDILKLAFVDLEDERFYDHNGIDIKGIFRAVYNTLTTTRMEGASTIDQQLIKNNVFETGGYERSKASTVKRKIQEWVLALQLDETLSKDEILTDYLNTLYLGAGNYGVKEAAKYYFGKELKDLTVAECCVIAAITQNPSANNPARFPEKNWVRAKAGLDKMLELGDISQEEYDEAISENVYDHVVALANQTAGNIIYTYYIDAAIDQVLDELQDKLGYTYTLLFVGGVSIYTCQNTKAQEIVDREINNPDNYSGIETSYSIQYYLSIRNADGSMSYYTHYSLRSFFQEKLDREGSEDIYYLDYASKSDADAAISEFRSAKLGNGEIIDEEVYYTLQPQASFTLMDYTNGRVLAQCGGRGDKETSMSTSRATDSKRQPGSTFKVVAAFAPALDTGKCTLATAFDDCELTYGEVEDYNESDEGSDYSEKSIANWWGDEYRGLSTIRMGIRDSMNIVACKTMAYIGAQTSLDYLASFGYKYITEADKNIATAIGGLTEGITNLENCAAYSAIANDGVYNEPIYFTKIVSKDGDIILDMEKFQESHEVISVETSSLITDALRDVVKSGTGVLCNITSAPLAGKTGTTNSYKDLWFVGYVPNGLCSAIWVGYDDNLSLSETPDAQKRFYSTIMDQLVVALGAEGGEFRLKGDIVEARVCSKSGLLSNGLCEDDPTGSKIITEYFINGTVPESSCRVHQKVTVCSVSGLNPTEYCKETEEKIVRVRPDALDGTEPKGETWDTEYGPPEEDCTECEESEEEETETDENGDPITTETAATGGETTTTRAEETTTAEEPTTTAEDPTTTAEEPTAAPDDGEDN